MGVYTRMGVQYLLQFHELVLIISATTTTTAAAAAATATAILPNCRWPFENLGRKSEPVQLG